MERPLRTMRAADLFLPPTDPHQLFVALGDTGGYNEGVNGGERADFSPAMVGVRR